jgi:hypothetical protein
MAGTTRFLSFAEGVSVGIPTQSTVKSTALNAYANDAAFVTAKGSAATTGDMYYNTTDNLIHYYDDASVWRLVEAEKNNYTASVAPTINDDTTSGYTVGSKWINTTADKAYVCVDASSGAAVWNLSGGSAGSPNDWTGAWADNFIQDVEYDIDYDVLGSQTAIEGRASLSDYENTVHCSMGIERMHFNSIKEVRDEHGDDFSSVYELENGDKRIRFYGNIKTSNEQSWGNLIVVTQNGVIEISFWGTGLNLFAFQRNVAGDFRAYVDGGALSGNLYSTGSDSLDAQGFDSAFTFNVTSGLTEGWHTVSIVVYSSNFWPIYGCEIINEATAISYQAGSGFAKTVAETISSAGTSAYNAGVSGTRGARVVKYLSGNAISQAVQEVNASASYATSVDHSNEEMYEAITSDSFGEGASDDFQITSASSVDRRFLMNDGGTSLIGDDVYKATTGTNGWALVSTGDAITYNFYGSGLDILTYGSNNDAGNPIDVYIDNTDAGAVGTLALAETGVFKLQKIASGLSLGWHTVKFIASSSQSYTHFVEFRNYRPKRPTVPVTSIELAEYDVLADHSAITTSGAIHTSQGVIRQSMSRYSQVSGSTWDLASFDINNVGPSGIFSNANGDSITKYFYGTGFELRWYGLSSFSTNVSLVLDGSADFSGFTSSTVGAGIVFTPGTGVLDQASSSTLPGLGLSVSGLDLGFHSLVMTNNTTSTMRIDSIDIITPIYNPGYNLGNTSLKDIRKFNPLNSYFSEKINHEAKALIAYNQITQDIFYTKNIA